jgi:hypothetical protein
VGGPVSFECTRCRERGQTWRGDAPRCGFYENGAFNSNNWNCATLNALRDRVANPLWNEDDHAGLVAYSEEREDGSINTVYLVLRWYKSRGRTDAVLWWEGDGMFPGTITLPEAEAVLA